VSRSIARLCRGPPKWNFMRMPCQHGSACVLASFASISIVRWHCRAICVNRSLCKFLRKNNLVRAARSIWRRRLVFSSSRRSRSARPSIDRLRCVGLLMKVRVRQCRARYRWATIVRGVFLFSSCEKNSASSAIWSAGLDALQELCGYLGTRASGHSECPVVPEGGWYLDFSIPGCLWVVAQRRCLWPE